MHVPGSHDLHPVCHSISGVYTLVSLAPSSVPQPLAPLLIYDEHPAAALADALQQLHRVLHVANVEHRQLQLDVTKVPSTVCQLLATGFTGSNLAADALQVKP
jgi:hypothetical protein